MHNQEFLKLIKKDRSQVFLFSSPLPIPTNFAVHVWLVTSKKGKLSRYDGWESKDMHEKNSYVYKDLFRDPTIGMNIIPLLKLPRWKGKIEGHIGGANAKEVIRFIEKEWRNYPFSQKYHYVPGPNSNTFIQWILNKTNSKMKLPWNAFGKNYLKIKSN